MNDRVMYNRAVDQGRVAFSPRLIRLGRKLVNMYYVYVLFSKSMMKRYIGLTEDLRSRFHEHNSGKSDFTKRGMPWSLIYYEAFTNKTNAAAEEVFLKSGKGRERLDLLLRKTITKEGGVA